MATKRDFICFLVDVGPSMHAHLRDVSEFLSGTMLSKLLYKPNHEVAVVLYGSTDTSNEPHDEVMAGEDPDPAQFAHVNVVRNLVVPDLAGLKLVRELPQGTGVSDLTDGLAVVADMFIKASKARALGSRVTKRVVIVSDLQAAGNGYEPDMMRELANSFRVNFVQLQAVVVGTPAGSQGSGPVYQENLHEVTQLLEDLGCGPPKHVCGHTELMACVHWKEVGHVATFRGWLHLTPPGQQDAVKIMVRTSKKVGQEKLPSLKLGELHDGQVLRLGRDVELHLPGQAAGEEPLAPEDVVKGFRYGPHVVPVLQPEDLKYAVTEEAMHLLGFVSRHQVPRYTFLGEPLAVLPDPKSPAAAPAVSALARAMAAQDKLALVRLVPKPRMAPRLLALAPWLSASPARPDCWVGVHIPFEEDLRWYEFPALAGPEQRPTDAQVAAMDALLLAVDLCPQEGTAAGQAGERLAPEETPNPLLARFYDSLMHRAVDGPHYPVRPAEHDPLLQAVLEPSSHASSAAADAAALVQALFPTRERPVLEKGKAGQRPSQAGGTQTGHVAAGSAPL